jgi:hypothetical protein
MASTISALLIVAVSATLIASFSATLFVPAIAQSSNGAQAANATEQQTTTLQLLVNQTTFENRALGDLSLSHAWSEIVLIPAGGSKSLNVFCETGSIPMGGGFRLGSQDLQVIGSHAFVSQNGSSFGWMVNVYNTNALTQAPAAANVLCLSEGGAAPEVPQEPAPAVPEPDEGEGMTVETDSDSYSIGNTITITGTIDDREPNASVLLTIVNPSSEEVLLTTVPVTASNTYRLSFDASDNGLEEILGNIGTSEMDESGSYLVTTSYCTGSGCAFAETTFEITAD